MGASGMVAESDDQAALFADSEGHVKATGEEVAMYERIGVCRPTQSVAWEGKRPPVGLTIPNGT